VGYIDAHKEEFGVEPICRVLQFAPSTYYAAKARPPSARDLSDARLGQEIQRIHDENYGVYGVRKVWRQILRDGEQVGRDQVGRIMATRGLEGVRRGKAKRTTTPADLSLRPADLVDRKFIATAPNRLWLADITYVWTWSGFCYTSFITDAFARRIVGWRVSRSLRTDLALDALEMAICTRNGEDLSELIHHSDRGVQGEFNRWSQHLVMVEVFDGSSTACSRPRDPSEAEIARASEVPARSRGRILGRDRQGSVARGSRGCRRGGAGGRGTVVPQRWRDAAIRSAAQSVGPLPVFC
jgi:putative transposase